MKLARLAVAILSFAIVAPLFASGMDWIHSPQSYFMTKAERQAWTAVRSDDDAQRFIDQFLARRGPDFAAEVASRAEHADKYLTLGKTPGSRTLRGKLVILFGPPSNLYVGKDEDFKAHHSSPAVVNEYTGGTTHAASGDHFGDESSEGSRSAGLPQIYPNPRIDQVDGVGSYDPLRAPAAQRSLAAAPSVVRVYQFTYASSVLGPFEVVINSDPVTGKDRPRDWAEGTRLAAAFEAAAEASIKVK
ncbi:MAG: GWxTD domain-containing protein [Thermoanaerobaculia bacterium]